MDKKDNISVFNILSLNPTIKSTIIDSESIIVLNEETGEYYSVEGAAYSILEIVESNGGNITFKELLQSLTANYVINSITSKYINDSISFLSSNGIIILS